MLGKGEGASKHASREREASRQGGSCPTPAHTECRALRRYVKHSREGRASGCSLCLWNDDKHQAAWAVLTTHESPFGDEAIYSPGKGVYITTGVGLQKTLYAKPCSGSQTQMQSHMRPCGGGCVPARREQALGRGLSGAARGCMLEVSVQTALYLRGVRSLCRMQSVMSPHPNRYRLVSWLSHSKMES